MNYLRVESIAKSYGERFLFSNITLTIAKGERVALIAKNGSGKTTLLNILTGREIPDEGNVVFDKNISWAYLEQEPQFNEQSTLIETVFAADNEILRAVANYELVIENSDSTPNELQSAMEKMDALNAWDIETKIHTILTQLNLHHHLNKSVNLLSGGQRKRLALARVLLQNPDLIILDEPTNHLDIQMIEWLESYLKVNDTTLLLVTHDRYFLDTVCTEIIELDDKKLFTYKGDYAYFLEKKEMRETFEAKELQSTKKQYKKELEWMRKQPKARTTKSKSRIETFHELKAKASLKKQVDKVEINMQMQRLGSKILETHQLKKSFGDFKICEDFTYLFKPGERIGVVGKNGVGKSTFLNLLLGTEKADSGRIIKGDTVKFAHYSQEGLDIKDDKRVIEVVTDIAEFIDIGKGQKLSATALLKRFLFDSKQQYNYVSTLSGGEKRRLYLLTILIQKPNFLVLDEPTNDLDIETLNVLEEFLEEYSGCLLVVTHDRYFMDNLVDSLLIFEGDGKIRSFNGNYQDYLNEMEEIKIANNELKSNSNPKKQNKSKSKIKLSFNEQRELELLRKELPKLQKRKVELEEIVGSGSSNYKELLQYGNELKTTNSDIHENEFRQLELSEF